MPDRSAWTDLHAHLHRTLKQRRLLEPGKRVLIAVSGGQDSLCLTRLLLDLQSKWHWQLAIAHCDHRWEGDIGNAEFVRKLAQSLALPFYQQTADTIDATEAGARTWRYQALVTIAQQHHFSHIVTGHTASDRAETLLYNLVRGSGSDGLQALRWQRHLTSDIMLVRPLLTVTRTETARFCQELSLRTWADPANQNLNYARNRVRQELFPYLCHHFNPQVERCLAQTAELLQADVAYLEQAAAELLQQCQHSERPGLWRTPLLQAPLALQRRVIRQFLQAQLPTAPNFEHIEKTVALLAAANRTQTDPYPGGVIARIDGDWLWLQPITQPSL